MNSVANFARIVQALHAADARVVVIGGLSLILHGGDHVTKDVDFAYQRTRENARKIAEALRPYHPRPIGFLSTFLMSGTSNHSSRRPL